MCMGFYGGMDEGPRPCVYGSVAGMQPNAAHAKQTQQARCVCTNERLADCYYVYICIPECVCTYSRECVYIWPAKGGTLRHSIGVYITHMYPRKLAKMNILLAYIHQYSFSIHTRYKCICINFAQRLRLKPFVQVKRLTSTPTPYKRYHRKDKQSFMHA
jgi:hypothetical protein